MKKLCLTMLLLMVTMSLVAACANKPKTADQAQTTETTQTTATAAEDDMAPNFELPDLQGNPRSLASLRGKYVIIDFWGSWCVWCIRGFPAMKDIYTKYKDDLEILGVACQDPEKKWRKAVEQYDLPWLQVRCPDDMLDDLAEMYGIEGFPTKAVVSPEGKLLKIVVGEDPEFYTYIDELLK